MYDVVVLGELLVDFTPNGISENGNPCFERNPGGGPANMACAVAKLGGKVAFLSQVGNDMFGQALKKTVANQNVDCTQVRLSDEYKTTLAFVGLDESGERSFSFYRRYGADTMMKTADYNLSVLKDTKYFFLSSVLMAEGTSRETSFEILEEVKKMGVPIVFDPNLRFNLWEDHNELKACVRRALRYADIVKVSDEELEYIMGSNNLSEAAKKMKEEFFIDILLVTRGKEGCTAYTNHGIVKHEGFLVEKPVDTTAAGDSFTGGFLNTLVSYEKNYSECSLEEIEKCIKIGNAVGSLTVTKKGAISALPNWDDVKKIIN